MQLTNKYSTRLYDELWRAAVHRLSFLDGIGMFLSGVLLQLLLALFTNSERRSLEQDGLNLALWCVGFIFAMVIFSRLERYSKIPSLLLAVVSASVFYVLLVDCKYILVDADLLGLRRQPITEAESRVLQSAFVLVVPIYSIFTFTLVFGLNFFWNLIWGRRKFST